MPPNRVLRQTHSLYMAHASEAVRKGNNDRTSETEIEVARRGPDPCPLVPSPTPSIGKGTFWNMKRNEI